VRRSLLALLVTLPAVIGGSLFAHATSYLMAAPDGHVRAQLLAATGHAYLERPELIAVVLLTVLAVGGLMCVHAEVRGSSVGRVSTRPFLLAAPLAFALQEHIERMLHGGDLPLTLFAQPQFLIGLALQLPFALLAVLLARLVLRGARVAGRKLRRLPRAPLPRPVARIRTFPPVAAGPRGPVLARCGAERAPPVAAVS
jgi:hypothetical protein